MLYEVETYYMEKGLAYLLRTKYYRSDKKIKPRSIKKRNYRLQQFITEYEERSN